MTTRTWIQDAEKNTADEVAKDMTERFHRKGPYLNKEARYEVGESKIDDPDMSGIFFIDKKHEKISEPREIPKPKKPFSWKAFLKAAFWPFKDNDQSVGETSQ